MKVSAPRIAIAGTFASLLFATYEVADSYKRKQHYEDINVLDSQEIVTSQLGKAFNIYNCKTGRVPSPLIYADNMCKYNSGPHKVYAFEHCLICGFFDPGWFRASDGLPESNLIPKSGAT